MSKATPGPWGHEVMNNGQIKIISRDGIIAVITLNSLQKKRAENAHLIAASPLLLEALEEAVGHCPCSVKERLSGHVVGCPAPEWMVVIGLAEGREP